MRTSSPPGFIRQHVARHKLLLSGIVGLSWFNSIVSFLLPLSIGEFFTVFFHTGSSKGRLLHWMGVEASTVSQFFLLFLGLLALKTLLTFLETYATFLQGELLVRHVREHIFAAQLKWDPVWFKGRAYGKYLLRYSNDLKSVQHGMTSGYLEAIKSGLFLLTGLLVMARINSLVTGLFAALLFAGFFLVYRFAGWQSGYITESRSARSSLLAFVAHQFSRFSQVKQQDEDAAILANFHEKSGTLFRSNLKFSFTESLLLALVPLLLFGIIAVVLWRMEYLQGSMTASEGLMLIMMLLMMEGGIRRLLKAPTYMNKGKISLLKIRKLLQEPTMLSKTRAVPAATMQD